MGSRNLTNKLWNAGKFLQMALAQCPPADLQSHAAAVFSSPDSLKDLPLTERWILSCLHQARPLPPSHAAAPMPAALQSRSSGRPCSHSLLQAAIMPCVRW